jgi:hypothetical protein
MIAPDALPLVSVLIPTHNYADFVGRSIESVLEQDYPLERLQIVVVDDGSEDDTAGAVAPYLEHVTYLHQKNRGLRGTVNRLLAAARGDLIALQSGDDIWLPGRLRAQVDQFLARPDLGLLYGDMRVIDAEERTLAESFWAMERITPLRGRPVPQLIHGNVVSGGTLMVRGSLRAEFEPLPEFAPWEDWWIALCVARVAEIDYLPQPLLGYRRHGRNMNLGVDHAQRMNIARQELPLRRWILTGFESELLGPADYRAAHDHWLSAAAWISRETGTPVETLLPLAPGDVAAARAAVQASGERLLAREFDTALREAVRARGHDPYSDPPQRQLARAEAALAGSAPVAPLELEARDLVVLADGAELIAAPELLAAYAAVFDGEADASLVIRIGADELEAFSASVAAAGLDTAEGPDLIGMPQPAGTSGFTDAVAAGADAVLSAREPAGPLAALPHFDAGGVARLHAAARRRWAGRAPLQAR